MRSARRRATTAPATTRPPRRRRPDSCCPDTRRKASGEAFGGRGRPRWTTPPRQVRPPAAPPEPGASDSPVPFAGPGSPAGSPPPARSGRSRRTRSGRVGGSDTEGSGEDDQGGRDVRPGAPGRAPRPAPRRGCPGPCTRARPDADRVRRPSAARAGGTARRDPGPGASSLRDARPRTPAAVPGAPGRRCRLSPPASDAGSRHRRRARGIGRRRVRPHRPGRSAGTSRAAPTTPHHAQRAFHSVRPLATGSRSRAPGERSRPFRRGSPRKRHGTERADDSGGCRATAGTAPAALGPAGRGAGEGGRPGTARHGRGAGVSPCFRPCRPCRSCPCRRHPPACSRRSPCTSGRRGTSSGPCPAPRPCRRAPRPAIRRARSP